MSPAEPPRSRVHELRLVVTTDDYDAERATATATEAGAEVVAPATLTPWGSSNARLEAPAGLQLTLFSEDSA